MEILWLLLPIGCIVMMLFGSGGRRSDWGCFRQDHDRGEDPEETGQHPEGTGDELGGFDLALRHRARAAGLSAEDTARLILRLPSEKRTSQEVGWDLDELTRSSSGRATRHA